MRSVQEIGVYDFLTSSDMGSQYSVPLWRCYERTHLAFTRGYIKRRLDFLIGNYRDVAQLVARTAGGGEAAGSSPVIPTKFVTM